MTAELTEKIKKFSKHQIAEIFLVIVGLITSLYLIIYKFKNYDIGVCNIESGIINCNKVIFSEYSQIFGIDLGILALLWFMSYTILRLLEKRFEIIKKLIDIYVILASLIVVYLVYIELVIIKYVCLLCTVLHIVIIGLLINRLFFFNKNTSILE